MANQNSIPESPYPVDFLPPLISDAVKEVANNLKIPMDLAAHAALSAISTACQGKINVKFPNFPAASCGLFLWVVSNASRGKSIANERFFRGVAKFEEEYNQSVTVDKILLDAQTGAWKNEGVSIKNELRKLVRGTDDYKLLNDELIAHGLRKPIQGKQKTICYAQITSQKLHEALVSDGVAAIISPEAGHLVLSEAFGQPGILSSFWSGEDQAMGLIKGDRKPYHPRLTISIMTQSDPFHEFMDLRGKKAFSSGLLSRFLVSFQGGHEIPQEAASIIDEIPEPCLIKFNNRIYEILRKGDVDFRDRICLEFSRKSKLQFEEFQQKINNIIKEKHVPVEIETFYRRLVQHASRIAALFQYFCNENEIIEDHVKNAIDLCSWYAVNYGNIFSKYLRSDISAGERFAKKLNDWLEKASWSRYTYPTLKNGIYSFRDLQNYAGFKGKAAELIEAINILESRRVINVLSGKKGALIVLYPFHEQSIHSIIDVYGLSDLYPNRPPVPYGSGPVPSSTPILDQYLRTYNYQENDQQHVTKPSVVTVNGAVNSNDLSYVQKELQEKATKECLGNITVDVEFVKNNSQ